MLGQVLQGVKPIIDQHPAHPSGAMHRAKKEQDIGATDKRRVEEAESRRTDMTTDSLARGRSGSFDCRDPEARTDSENITNMKRKMKRIAGGFHDID